MLKIRNSRKNPTSQKLVVALIIGIIMIFIGFSLSVLLGAFHDISNDFQRIALSLMLLWIGILLSYYLWAIFYYNVNLGHSDAEWKDIWERIDNARKKRELGLEVDPKDLEEPKENPYKSETFGLPAGTVRGTIALTLLMGGISMLIMAIGYPQFSDISNFKFFVDAFLMMVAFYFGSKSLQYLQQSKKEEKEGEPAPIPALPPIEVNEPEIPGVIARPASLEEEEELAKEFPQVKEQEENKKLSDEIIKETAKDLDVDAAALKAVIQVESAGSGFLNDGRPKILFEGHVFWRELEKRSIDPGQYAQGNPEILYKHWTKKYYRGKEGEYDRLERAKLIDQDAALCSASWGLFQIMGFNYKAAGFDTVHSFVEAQHKDESEHLRAFCNFMKHEKILSHLKTRNWAEFARRYNGPAYKKNRYDEKIAMAYRQYKDLFATETESAAA